MRVSLVVLVALLGVSCTPEGSRGGPPGARGGGSGPAPTAVGSRSGSAAAYRVVDLGRRGLDAGAVRDLSRSGLVLAEAARATSRVAWIQDLATGETRDVPAAATVVNGAGVVAGVRPAPTRDPCGDVEVFLQLPDGTERGLGNPVAGDYGGAPCDGRMDRTVTALTDSGQVLANWDRLESGKVTIGAFVWDGAAWRRLPGLGGDTLVLGWGADGSLVGQAFPPWSLADPQVPHAALWRAGALHDLGPGAAYGVDAHGAVLGQQDGWAVRWGDGGVERLGALPGFEASLAVGADARGAVAGTSSYSSWQGPSSWRAALFVDGQVMDLNDLVDGHDVQLVRALRISDGGAIVAEAHGASLRAVVLVPTGAPLVADRAWRETGTILASGELASGLALDATNVYWITVNARRQVAVRTTPKEGGPVTTLWSTDAGFTYGNLVADGAYLWFDLTVCAGVVCPTPSAIWRLAKTGGAPERVGDGSSLLSIDAQVYTTRDAPGGFQQELLSYPEGGGPATVLATGEIEGLAVDGGEVFTVEGVQVGSFHLAALRREPGGVASTLDQATLVPPSDFSGGALRLDATSVYLRDARHLLRFPRTGGAPALLASIVPDVGGGESRPELELQGGTLYWTQDMQGGEPACLMRVDAGGGAPACVDSGYWRYPAARADASSLFFVRDAEIVRLPR